MEQVAGCCPDPGGEAGVQEREEMTPAERRGLEALDAIGKLVDPGWRLEISTDPMGYKAQVVRVGTFGGEVASCRQEGSVQDCLLGLRDDLLRLAFELSKGSSSKR